MSFVTVTIRHRLICEYTWGAIPLDYEWAVNSPIYIKMEAKLIERGIISTVK